MRSKTPRRWDLEISVDSHRGQQSLDSMADRVIPIEYLNHKAFSGDILGLVPDQSTQSISVSRPRIS